MPTFRNFIRKMPNWITSQSPTSRPESPDQLGNYFLGEFMPSKRLRSTGLMIDVQTA
jgi:hypothetical protein